MAHVHIREGVADWYWTADVSARLPSWGLQDGIKGWL
jgi:hypothetical protein